MKRVIKLIILLLMIMPLYVKGLTYNSYDKCIKDVNNYINKYSKNHKFLLYGYSYEYRNGVIQPNTVFKKGGLLSRDEYMISKRNSGSYLATGKQYWTLSSKNGEQYYIDYDIASKDPSEPSSVRVTEYVKPEINVNGKGTYASPWYFLDQYSVEIRVRNKNHGSVNPSTDMVNPKTVFTFDIEPKVGYEYKFSDCDITKIAGTKYKTQPITKDTICILDFGLRKIQIKYLCGDGTGEQREQSVIYGNNYSILDYYCSKTGYTQNKWAASTTDGTEWTKGDKGKFEIENGNLGIANNTLTLLPMWNANTFTVQYNGNGSTGGSTPSHTCTYDGTCTLTNNGFTKKGYLFGGWKKENTGNTLSEGDSIKNAASSGSVTYYAQWIKAKTFTLISNKQINEGNTFATDYGYTGSEVTIDLPLSLNYIFQVWGAQGGPAKMKTSDSDYIGGYGGFSTGKASYPANTRLYLDVGGSGAYSYRSRSTNYCNYTISYQSQSSYCYETSGNTSGGFNGGGLARHKYYTYYASGWGSGAGGGATHIATSSSTTGIQGLSGDKDSILIVAGGGGGAGHTYRRGTSSGSWNLAKANGGSAGGFKGNKGGGYTIRCENKGESANRGGSGATQTSGAYFGKGGQSYANTSSYSYVGAGGGGYYGGNSGYGCETDNNMGGWPAGGGGGSGYINTSVLTDAYMVGYSTTTSDAIETKTISTSDASDSAIVDTAKSGAGYARITTSNNQGGYYLNNMYYANKTEDDTFVIDVTGITSANINDYIKCDDSGMTPIFVSSNSESTTIKISGNIEGAICRLYKD